MQNIIKKLFFLFTIHCSLFTIHCSAQVTQLWGMTSNGGTDSSGVIFRIFTNDTAIENMHSFTKATGSFPRGNLINVNNELYGMTDSGGTHNGGVIFKFDPIYFTYTVLYNFDTAKYTLDTLSGKWPSGSLLYVGNNLLYGMTNSGGLNKKGVIFSFNISTNQYAIVHHFAGTDGQYPSGSLYQDTAGNLDGMTPLGGADSAGVLFSLNPSTNTFTKLLDFNGANGANPRGNVIQASDGNLYGMTYGGGDSSRGVIFTINPINNSFGLVFTFHGLNGAFPYNSLYQANNQKLYGFNIADPNGFNTGSLFSQQLTGLHVDGLDFASTNFGRSYSNVIQSVTGLLYSMTFKGGDYPKGTGPDSVGVIFSFDIATNVTTLVGTFHNYNGANPYGDLLELPGDLGIQNIPNNVPTVSIYPNPSTDIANVVFKNGKDANYLFVIYDLLGQEVFSKNQFIGRNTTMSFNLDHFNPGIYFYKLLQNGNEFITAGKFIIE